MAGGQMLDLEAERRPPDTDGVLRLQALKTGALITFACEAGAMLGKGTPDQRRALVGYGRALGLAFQISDDLLDAQGDATVIGKAVGKDDAAGKATLVSRLGLDGARSRLRAVVEEAEAALAPFGARATRLCEAVRWMAERRR
jgi:farnesyl diphosphate synthase